MKAVKLLRKDDFPQPESRAVGSESEVGDQRGEPMSTLFLMFELRFAPFVLSILSSAILAAALALHPTFAWLWVGFGIAFFFLAVGVRDLLQTRHAVLRNYPIAAPALHPRGHPAGDAPVLHRGRQGRPAVQPRQALDRLPARQEGARQAAVRHPATTSTSTGYEWINHSIAPAPVQQGAVPHHDRRAGLHQPYSASVFNISAMSFGALSAPTRSSR